MIIHLPADETWNAENKAIRASLGLADDPRFTVQIYTSISHALAEVCFSLSDLIPHKKTFAYFDKNGPEFDSVAVSLSKKEMTLKSFSRDEISKPEYLVGLSKDLLALVTSSDDPILAARHDFGFLDDQLKEKRYFHVRISNFLHQLESFRLPTHYEVLILSLGADRTLVIAGERAKIKPELTPKLCIPWNAENRVLAAVSALAPFEKGRELNPIQAEKLKAKADLQCQHILEFERDLPAGISPYFGAGQDRVFDRAAMVCEGVDGLSMITRLQEYIVEPLTSVQLALETTSLCRWQNARFFEYLGLDEKIRGVILIDAQILNSVFKALVAKVYLELLAEQNEVLSLSTEGSL